MNETDMIWRGLLHISAVMLLVLFFAVGCGGFDPTEEIRQAVIETQRGEYESALRRTRQCLKYNPKDISIQILNSYCHLMTDVKERERAQALHNLYRAYCAAPESFDAAYFYGWALFQAKRYSEAIEPLERAFALRDENNRDLTANLQVMSGTCYAENNLQDKAMTCLQPLRINPAYRNDPRLYNILGMMALKRSEPQQALKFFQQALRVSPGDRWLLQNMAVTYDLYLNDIHQAHRCYMACCNAKYAAGDRPGVSELHRRMRQLAERRPAEQKPQGRGK